MKDELKEQLLKLSIQEKGEVVDFLLVELHRQEPSPELVAEIDRRIDENEADPSGSITLEEFKERLSSGRKDY